MSELTRFGVAIEESLLKEFDQLIPKKGYANRSGAIRDIIRESPIAEDVTHPDTEGTGSINIVFNHHKAHLSDRLTHIPHDSKLHFYSRHTSTLIKSSAWRSSLFPENWPR